MKEWLKEINLEPDFSKRITKNVIKRAKKRKITERIAISSLSFFFVAFLIVYGSRNLQVANVLDNDNNPQVAKFQETGSRNIYVANVLDDDNNPQVAQIQNNDNGTQAKDLRLPLHPKTTQAKDLRLQACGYEPAPPITPKLQKVDDSLEITWQGEGEFLVYKCESPKFDTCSFVKVVKGNKFLDKNEGSGKIVFYRIEPLKKG
jgi:hypothetical protein